MAVKILEKGSETHRITRVHEDKPEGPFLCSCGLVCWDAEAGMHHLIDSQSRPVPTPYVARR